MQQSVNGNYGALAAFCHLHVVWLHRSFTGRAKSGQIGRFSKKLKMGLASPWNFPYISFLRKGTAERSDAVIGMSSNGRTADSGSVNGGSTPSIPAIAFATYGPFV